MAVGKIPNAIEHYAAAQTICPETDQEGKALAFIYQQKSIYATGKNAEAFAALKALLDDPSRSLSQRSLGLLYQTLANISRSQADFHSAEKYFQQSIAVAKEVGDTAMVLERTGELGRVYRSSGVYQKALELQKQLYSFALSRGDKATLAAACGYLGFTYYSKSSCDYDKAVMYLASRHELAVELGDLQGARWCINNIGKVYQSLNKHQTAVAMFKRSCEVARELGDLLGEGTALGNMGTSFRAMEKYSDALNCHELYMKNAELRRDVGGVAIMQNELALDYLHNGDLESACKYAWLAVRTGLEIRSQMSGKDDVLKMANFDKNQAKAYNTLQYVLAQRGMYTVAMLVSEMGRARALADILVSRSKKPSKLFGSLDHDLMDSEGRVNQNLVDSTLSEICLLLAKLRSSLIAYSIVNSPLNNANSFVYIWAVSTSAQGEAVNVNYSSIALGEEADLTGFGDGYFSDMMQEMGVREVKFTAVPSKSRDISLISNELQDDVESHKLVKLSRLYDILIKPVECHLQPFRNQTIPRIVFVPSGPLFSVPFPALVNSEKVYVIEKFVVSIAPSIAILDLMYMKVMSMDSKEKETLVVGNPSMPIDAITQLPGSEKEAKAVASIMGCDVLCGKEATKNEVMSRLPQARVVHLATHALLSDKLADHLTQEGKVSMYNDGDYTVKGAIVLARSLDTDNCTGVLTSSEIQNMNLKGELIVLSCCKTGCGKIIGDGILGLSRALLVAGVQCLLATLWSINDECTADLMQHFYLNYSQCHDAPLALQRAMSRFKDRNPGTWGAFFVMGISPL